MKCCEVQCTSDLGGVPSGKPVNGEAAPEIFHDPRLRGRMARSGSCDSVRNFVGTRVAGRVVCGFAALVIKAGTAIRV
jgi:hypothetical protein